MTDGLLVPCPSRESPVDRQPPLVLLKLRIVGHVVPVHARHVVAENRVSRAVLTLADRIHAVEPEKQRLVPRSRSHDKAGYKLADVKHPAALDTLVLLHETPTARRPVCPVDRGTSTTCILMPNESNLRGINSLSAKDVVETEHVQANYCRAFQRPRVMTRPDLSPSRYCADP